MNIMFGLFKNTYRSQKGVSFMETIITLPVLLIICACTVETSQFIRFHIAGSQLAYEGARMAAGWAALPDLSRPNKVSIGAETSIRDRMLVLAKKQEMNTLGATHIQIEYFPATAVDPANTVQVNVNVPYTPVFDLWGKNSINSVATIAYLYPEN